MKVIDLLNKIANGEEVPKKIKYQFKTFELSDNEVYLRTDKVKDYDYGWKTLLQYILECDLNDEVEIIEEDKKIEKISVKTNNHNVRKVANKINELIKAVNELNKNER